LPKYADEVRKNLKPGEALPKLDVKITSNRITVGAKGQKPYLDVRNQSFVQGIFDYLTFLGGAGDEN
jgi:hypothetical protein